MSRKSIDYKTFKVIQKMSLNEFNHWLMDLCSAIYEDGAEYVKSECVAALTDERLMEILLSVKGIGVKRANQAVTKILMEGTDYYGN